MSFYLLHVKFCDGGGRPSCVCYRHEFDSMEQLAIFINTGVFSGDYDICEDKDIDFTYVGRDIVITKVVGDYIGLIIMHNTYNVELSSGVVIPAYSRHRYLDLSTQIDYLCYFNKVPYAINNYPAANTKDNLRLLTEIKDVLTPWVQYHLRYLADNLIDADKLALEIVTNPEIIKISPDVDRVTTLNITITPELGRNVRDGTMQFKEDDLSFNLILNIFERPYRTYIDLDLITIPRYLRRKGIYTSIIQLISKHLRKFNLGDTISFTDSSDDGTTSRIAAAYDVYGDPIMYERYQLVEKMKGEVRYAGG